MKVSDHPGSRAAVCRRVQVPIAADESIHRADDPLMAAVAEAADIAVIKCTPLGGVRRSLEVAAAAGLPCVVSSALETGVGLAARLALAGALPDPVLLDTYSLNDPGQVARAGSWSLVFWCGVLRTTPKPGAFRWRWRRRGRRKGRRGRPGARPARYGPTAVLPDVLAGVAGVREAYLGGPSLR